MKILHVVGARPNFMKAAPVMYALSKSDNVTQVLVHTGQHYDTNMSEVFFRQLELPEPDINLEVRSESHAVQTAQIMIRIEEVLLEQKPDLFFYLASEGKARARYRHFIEQGIDQGSRPELQGGGLVRSAGADKRGLLGRKKDEREKGAMHYIVPRSEGDGVQNN